MAPAVLTPHAARSAETAHAEANATLTRILGAIEEYVYTGEFLSGGGYRLVFAGPCRERFLGMTAGDARGAVWADHVHPGDLARFDDAHDRAAESGRLDVEYRMVGADGRTRWVRDRGRMRLEDGRRFLDGSVLDVTAIRSAQKALEAARADALRASELDPLTGAYNRRTLRARIEALGDRPVGVLCLDLDRFKHINDFYGHAAGDAVLVDVAARLRAAVRESDAVYRTGGEEFLLVLPDVPDEAAVRDVAEAVRAAVAAEAVSAAGETIAVTASVGAAHATPAAGAVEALLAGSDRAMYAAKRAGRDCVRVASAHLDDDDPDARGGGAALALAEAMASVAALHGAGRAVAPGERATLAARVARRLGATPPQVLRCRLAALLLGVGGRDAAGAEATIGAVPELRPVLPILRQVRETGVASAALEARVVAGADGWLAGSRVATPDPVVAGALRSVLALPRESDAT